MLLSGLEGRQSVVAVLLSKLSPLIGLMWFVICIDFQFIGFDLVCGTVIPVFLFSQQPVRCFGLLKISTVHLQNSLPDEKIVIFVVSTTGQGDVPDSMKVTRAFFWKLMMVGQKYM